MDEDTHRLLTPALAKELHQSWKELLEEIRNAGFEAKPFVVMTMKTGVIAVRDGNEIWYAFLVKADFKKG